MAIRELEKCLRDLVSSPWQLKQLMDKPADWNTLCSAMDVVGDTELALTAFRAEAFTNNDGVAYLLAYGALQVLQSQQDALEHIRRVLGMPHPKRKQLVRIKRIRSHAVGHPTASRESGIELSHFIVRASLRHDGFQLMSVASDEFNPQFQWVDLPELIDVQRGEVERLLRDTVERLQKAETERVERNKAMPLSDAIPATLSYRFEKILEATHNSDLYALGAPNLGMIAECLNDLRTRLEQRGEWGAYDSIECLYDEFEYPMAQLEQYFTALGGARLNAQDAYIFATFVRVRFDELCDLVTEIDGQ